MALKYKAYFRCISGCSAGYPLDEVIYRCPKCASLLEVHHELEPLKERSPEQWKKLFESRTQSSPYPFASGIWNKKEWILPNIKDENILSTLEGNTSLLPLKRYGEKLGLEKLFIKQCGNSHTGSFKDLGMTVLVSQVNEMIKAGKPITALAAASTGDTSASLSAYASMAGIPSIVFLPSNKVSLAQLIQSVANGTIVLSLDTDFDGCMEMVKKITEDNSIYLANSMNSLRLEGQKTISIEICQQLGWEVPDWIIIPGGNLGNVSALGKGFIMMEDLGLIKKKPRIVVAQAQNANPLFLAFKQGLESFSKENFQAVKAKKTLASAIQIGNPVSMEKAVSTLKKFNGLVEQATEQEIMDASAAADLTGLFNCPHTGVALAALNKLVDRNLITKDHLTVVISTAHGLKFSHQKVAYHSSTLAGIISNSANPPIEIPNNEEKVRRELSKRISGFAT